MRKIWNKGHRIRASDKHLVYHFSIGTLLFVFVAVLLLLNSIQLRATAIISFDLFINIFSFRFYISNMSFRKICKKKTAGVSQRSQKHQSAE